MKYLAHSINKITRIELIVKKPKWNLEKRTGEKYKESKTTPIKTPSQNLWKKEAKTTKTDKENHTGKKITLIAATKKEINLIILLYKRDVILEYLRAAGK